MLDYIRLNELLFLDIETVPAFPSFEAMPETLHELWAVKHSYLQKDTDETPQSGYLRRAGVYAEFAKIICISIGYFHYDANGHRTLRIKSFYGDDEYTLLKSFTDLLFQKFNVPGAYRFCGHNIREFDVPFICRRLIINMLPLPQMLDKSGQRPWDNPDVDTLQLWKFGDYKHYTSLKLLAAIMNIPTPKDEIEGKDVCRVYWQEKNLNRIVSYCQKDVVTVARLLLRFKGDTTTLADEDVVIVANP
ncbi:MAG: ribonuclease H-like domain-containing protein [Chitinophagales bacterium]|nr:ribonuclease H-like domain-containing protein [Chitinophagales bacterium]MDW8419211.1 ribonuclease H-like domain-containing protein [Chitinophagales bacterium]